MLYAVQAINPLEPNLGLVMYEENRRDHPTISSGISIFVVMRESRLIAHLFPEVLQHVFTAASQVGLQQDSVPLLIMHGLGDLAAQEPEEKVADTLALWRERKTNSGNIRRGSADCKRKRPMSTLLTLRALFSRNLTRPLSW